MKYIWSNIWNFMRKHTFLFLLLVLAISGSSIMIHMAYGLYQNYQLEKEYTLTSQNSIQITLRDNYKKTGEDVYLDSNYNWVAPEPLEDYVTVGDMKRFARKIENIYGDNLKYIISYPAADDLQFTCYYKIRDGKLVGSEEYALELKNKDILPEGRYFQMGEYNKSKNVALVWRDEDRPERVHKLVKKMMIDETHIQIQGKSYEIIGYHADEYAVPYVPITTFTDDTPLTTEIVFCFDEPVQKEQFEPIKKLVSEEFGTMAMVIPLKLPEDDAIYIYNTIILIAVLITVISALNFCILYRYILSTRERELRIYRICGLSFWNAVKIYLLECMILTMGIYILSVIAYIIWLSPVIASQYKYMKEFFGMPVYGAFLGIYFFLSLGVTFIMVTIVLKKNGRILR